MQSEGKRIYFSQGTTVTCLEVPEFKILFQIHLDADVVQISVCKNLLLVSSTINTVMGFDSLNGTEIMEPIDELESEYIFINAETMHILTKIKNENVLVWSKTEDGQVTIEDEVEEVPNDIVKYFDLKSLGLLIVNKDLELSVIQAVPL